MIGSHFWGDASCEFQAFKCNNGKPSSPDYFYVAMNAGPPFFGRVLKIIP